MLNVFRKKPRIFFMSAQNDGCNWYRVFLPSKHLKKFRTKVSVDNFYSFQPKLNNDKATIKFLEKADIISLQRLASFSVIFFIENMKMIKPRKIFFDCDDLVDKIYKSNLGSLYYDEERLKLFDTIIRNCDLITVTTQYLKEQWKNKNENIVVIPNSIDFDYIVEAKKDYSPKKKLKILISGSCLYPENLSLKFVELLKKISEKYDLVLYGIPIIGEEEWKTMKKESKEMYYKMRDFMKPIQEIKKAEIIENTSFGEYYEKLALINPDIALIPRGEHEFNFAKSNLKILEMGANKIPCIVSSMREYEEFINNGLVLSAKDNDEWIEQIKELENPELRKKLATNNFAYIKEKYNILNISKIWDSVYEEYFYGTGKKN